MEELENIVISVRIDTTKNVHSQDFELNNNDVDALIDAVDCCITVTLAAMHINNLKKDATN